MEIALINSPVRLNDSPKNIPVGLGIIAKVLLNNGFTIKWIDLNARRDLINSYDFILNEILNSEIVGISGLITTYSYQKNLINKIKEAYPKKLVVS